MSSVSIITLGCKQNKYESDCMQEILQNAGYTVFSSLQMADYYIINTCAVTAEAEKKSRQYIEKCNKLNPNCKIIICGCASQNDPTQFENKKNVISVFGTEGKQDILKYLSGKSETVDIPKVYSSISAPFKSNTRENLKIQDGCNNFCSYCLIPYLRGRSRSRNLDDIVAEAETIANRSHEIVLTGIDISSFEIDGVRSLGTLMSSLSGLNCLISLGSLEVGVIDEKFLKILSKMPNFSPHFHLSLQSGCDEILKKMNRHYTTQQFLEKVNLIRKYFPLANITTDVIVGFAGETDEQFAVTVDFVKKCQFSHIHIFPYSKRKGTLAYNFADIEKSVKKQRVDALESVNKELSNQYLSKFIGKNSTMITEEKKQYFEGFSREYIRCYCEQNLVEGQVYNITFESIYKDGMKVKVL